MQVVFGGGGFGGGFYTAILRVVAVLKKKYFPETACYSTSPRNRNRVNRNHLGIFLSSSQKNRNSLAWVVPTKKACFLGEQYSRGIAYTDLSDRN